MEQIESEAESPQVIIEFSKNSLKVNDNCSKITEDGSQVDHDKFEIKLLKINRNMFQIFEDEFESETSHNISTNESRISLGLDKGLRDSA